MVSEARRIYNRLYMRQRRAGVEHPKIDAGIPKKIGRPMIEEVKREKPLIMYNPLIHKAGDRVLVRKEGKLVEVIVPEIDGEGNEI